MAFSGDVFDKLLLDLNCVGFRETKLASGRLSHYYVNIRQSTSSYSYLTAFARHMVGFRNSNGLRGAFIGIPDGATALAQEANRILIKDRMFMVQTGLTDLPVIALRKTPKDHGTPESKYFVVSPPKARRLKYILFEDVTTTGASVMEHIPRVLEAGYDIEAVVAAVNRLEYAADGVRTVKRAIESTGIPYYSMSDAARLLPKAARMLNPPLEIRKAIFGYPHSPVKIKL